MRRTIRCVAQVEVIGSGVALDETHGITVLPRGRAASGFAPLRTSGGYTDLHLAVSEHYVVGAHAGQGARVRYNISTVSYVYAIVGRDERELLAYHLHPEGVSDVTFPHLHIPRAAPIPLARTDPVRAVAVGEMHLPTNRVLLEDVVELLIREFGVVPLRPDWQAILDDNRAAVLPELP